MSLKFLKVVSKLHISSHQRKSIWPLPDSISATGQTGSTLKNGLSHICSSPANTQPAADWLCWSQCDWAYRYSPWPDSNSRGCVASRSHTVHHIALLQSATHTSGHRVVWFLSCAQKWHVCTINSEENLSFLSRKHKNASFKITLASNNSPTNVLTGLE